MAPIAVATFPESASATPTYMKLMVFVIFALAVALFLGGAAVIFTYRNRQLAVASGTRVSLTGRVTYSDLEKGDTAGRAHQGCKPITGLLTLPFRRFLRWRHRVLYESDSMAELALLPWYRPKESIWKKIVNFVLWKKRVVPDPPTIVTATRFIEEVAKARERTALGSTATGAANAAKSSPVPSQQAPPPPTFQIPEIIVQCWDDSVEPTPSNPGLMSSSSTISSVSTASSTSSCASFSASSLMLSPATTSPATFYFPTFPRAGVSSFDYLNVPPPSYGTWGGSESMVEVPAHVSNVSGERFVLAPPPRALIKGKAVLRSIPASFATTATEERKEKQTDSTHNDVDEPHLSLQGPVGIAGASGTGNNGEAINGRRRKQSDPPHPTAEDSDSDALILPIRLTVSSSTTSSLIDLLLEALAADTDYATASSSSSSFSSSSRDSTASTSSTASFRSACDGDVDTDMQTGKHPELEDESEEDFLDAFLSAYLESDDGPSERDGEDSNAGSDYGELDEVDLRDDLVDVSGALPGCRESFVEAAWSYVVHGLAI